MIVHSGLINEKIKLKMLDYWMKKHGKHKPIPHHAKNHDKESLGEELLRLVELFIGRNTRDDAFENRNIKFINGIVLGEILDEDWLEFSRTKLKLSDKEIENIIGRHGEFSDEFKYQLIKKLQQEEMEEPCSQEWELRHDGDSSDISDENN
uniref:uncharacterized protein LOC120338415 n=1 Tax=Styela clava TaxID=7725 RepID=UPI00193A3E82|nr:uncharacterized protein LOC120338415 [Styela clava]